MIGYRLRRTCAPAAFGALAVLGGCTAGQAVDDTTNTAQTNLYVEFVQLDAADQPTNTMYSVRTSASGQFAFDPDASTNSVSVKMSTLPTGRYQVFTASNNGCFAQTQHVSAPFTHTYDTSCKGSNGDQESCEYYQLRLSESSKTISDDHAGTRTLKLTHQGGQLDGYNLPGCPWIVPGNPYGPKDCPSACM